MLKRLSPKNLMAMGGILLVLAAASAVRFFQVGGLDGILLVLSPINLLFSLGLAAMTAWVSARRPPRDARTLLALLASSCSVALWVYMAAARWLAFSR